MLSILLAVLPALLVGTSAAAVVPRDRTCTLELWERLGQNPVVGGDNSHTCGVELDYGDGRKDTLTTECNKIWHSGDHCYDSQLPNSIW
ncbi:uncharacterized protein N7479_010501 [Penicillium vulpinum]|uniref:uncharacterized protein n=1 Tax=Penicillium vulpinum TaxID=29845 RepID=UPI00254866C5|nr:uncharacterized protein N7479_010501 [Penicillium vulpinum]KAJ5952088.1 hypothetical protein N7479_010501 [Penicillium vulpinum]